MRAASAGIHPAIAGPLIASGNYRLDGGRLKSVHLRELTPNPRHPGSLVTPLIAGDISSIKGGTHTVYQPFPEGRALTGLAECVRIETPGGPPIYVVDNHTGAYFGWREANVMGYTEADATLLHVDMHSDNKVPDEWPASLSLAEAAEYTRRVLDIECFVLPAIADGTIGEFWDIECYSQERLFSADMGGRLDWTGEEIRTRSYEDFRANRKDIRLLRERPKVPLQKILGRPSMSARRTILDIDVDAFVGSGYSYPLPTVDEFYEAARFLAQIARHAGVVTIATSPGYALQRVAIPVAQRIAEEILKATYA